MNALQEKDYELIAQAKKAIRLNYDQKKREPYRRSRHTLQKRQGICWNVYSLHGACAEQVAMGDSDY